MTTVHFALSAVTSKCCIRRGKTLSCVEHFATAKRSSLAALTAWLTVSWFEWCQLQATWKSRQTDRNGMGNLT
jgi:hypothetical protein